MPLLNSRLRIHRGLLLMLRHSGLLRIRLHWVLLLLCVLLLLSRILVASLLHWFFWSNSGGPVGRTRILVGASDRGVTTYLAVAVNVDAGYDEGDKEEDAGGDVLVLRSNEEIFDGA